ncbi:hypothetical protein VNO78_17615 [Psophocarpus tetragonolobus]|uniref:glutathione transferase n=1 Tax=Psophocarpus tetragonolobus TaxID=3891 RepID=A0AAN9XKT6_PSOTE
MFCRWATPLAGHKLASAKEFSSFLAGQHASPNDLQALFANFSYFRLARNGESQYSMARASKVRRVRERHCASKSLCSLGVRIPPFSSTSDPPPLFDGTTRLYTSYTCPYAQRVWIAMNYKGLQDKIELVPIDIRDMPAWYKEKVYPVNKVPSLEHNGKVLGESLDLIKYVDANFEGPPLVPADPAKKEFGEQLTSHIDSLMKDLYASFKGEDPVHKAGASFDYLENALGKFDDGPFFLGQFSFVDAAYAPFVERLEITFSEVYKNDITSGRSKLATYIEELNKIDAYKTTKVDPQEFVEVFKKWLLVMYTQSKLISHFGVGAI